MKKFSLVILCVAMLMTAMLPVNAAATAADYMPAHPKGYYNPNVEHADTLNRAEFSKVAANLGTDLSAIAYERGSSNYSGTLDTEAKFADVADTNYGISLIGGLKLDRAIRAVSDHVWSQGGKTLNNVAVGAGGWSWAGKFYNENGVTKGDDLPTGEYIYNSMLTYNFGAKKSIDYVILAQGSGNDWITGAPAAGDIYVSDDGVNWTLVSYWDVPQMLVDKTFENGKVYDYAMEKDLGKDKWQEANNQNVSSSNKVLALDLNGVEGQYLRLAFSAAKGLTGKKLVDGVLSSNNITSSDPNALIGSAYENLSNNIYSNGSISCRDILVYGGEADVAEQAEKVEMEGVQLSAVANGAYKARLVASVDSLSYKSAGFNVAIRYYKADNFTRTATATGTATDYATTSAFTTIKAVQSGVQADWSVDGRYLIAMNINNIPTDCHLVILTVTPYAVNADGTRVDGQSYDIAFLDGVYYASNIAY